MNLRNIEESVNWPKPGRYLLAVSGGADSVVLLRLMAGAAGKRGYELTVAHFDHGMRADSDVDRALVAQLCRGYEIDLAARKAIDRLSSEAAARDARYEFLREQAIKVDAKIVTAHHQDDLIETSLLNLARGTNRRGLAPLSGGEIVRPLLGLSRDQLRNYAADQKLTWNEDPSNEDRSNPRNFLRHELLARVDEDWKRRYIEIIERVGRLNEGIDRSLQAVIDQKGATVTLDRAEIREWSLAELGEVIAWSSSQLEPGVELGQRLVEELALFAKTGAVGKARPIRGGLTIRIMPDKAEIRRSKPVTNAPF